MDERSPQERRRELTRERIHASALLLFFHNGYHETSVAQIADAAAISERTFFRYFSAKDDVLFMLPENLIPTAQHVIAGVPEDVPDWDALRMALSDYATFMEANKESVQPTAALMHSVPELCARRMLMEDKWAQALATGLARRREEDDAAWNDVALAAAAIAIYAAAVKRWTHEAGLSLPDVANDLFRQFDSSVLGRD